MAWINVFSPEAAAAGITAGLWRNGDVVVAEYTTQEAWDEAFAVVPAQVIVCAFIDGVFIGQSRIVPVTTSNVPDTCEVWETSGFNTSTFPPPPDGPPATLAHYVPTQAAGDGSTPDVWPNMEGVPDGSAWYIGAPFISGDATFAVINVAVEVNITPVEVQYGAGVPAAISSELDHGGEERIHIAFMQTAGVT